MNKNIVAIFSDGSCMGNPGPTEARAVILKNDLNKPTIELAKTVSNNSTNYHSEVEAPLLGLKYITSLPTPSSFNNVHIFSDSTAAINVTISTTQQDLHNNPIEEINKFLTSLN